MDLLRDGCNKNAHRGRNDLDRHRLDPSAPPTLRLAELLLGCYGECSGRSLVR